ncbi:MAG: hypothetical protein V3G42_09525 [Oscillospiraceae bacterium]
MKKIKIIIISALLFSCCVTGCGNYGEEVIVETLPSVTPTVKNITNENTSNPDTTDATENPSDTQEEIPTENAIPSEFTSLLNDYEFQDCLNMIVSPKNPLNLTNGAPHGYAIGKPFRFVEVNNGVDGFDVEAGEVWQFPVITSGQRIVGTISAYGSVSPEGVMTWKHFSATEGIAVELTENLAEYEAFALFMDGTDDTHSGIIYGITPKNKTITIAQDSSDLVALLKLDEGQRIDATDDALLAQRISNLHKLRGDNDEQPFQTLEYHDVWGFNNTVNTKLFYDLIYVSPDYKEEAPPTEDSSSETDETFDEYDYDYDYDYDDTDQY